MRQNKSPVIPQRQDDTPIEYEIPRAAIAEAIVNAVAHRDYTSTGAVLVILFRDRLEIWNPGQLPHNFTLPQLKQPHSSFPANPLIAEPLYLAGYIERLGTDILKMIRLCKEAGLNEPEFKQEDVFKAIIRRSGQAEIKATPQATPQAEFIKRIILVMTGEYSREKIQDLLGLRDRKSFSENYLTPAIKEGYIEMTIPKTPTSPNQRYRLTPKGKASVQKLKSKNI